MRKISGIDSDISRARVLLSRYNGANLSGFSRIELESLVGIYYHKIKRRPISVIPDAQLYRIAQRLYQKAHEMVKQENLRRRG